MARIIVTGAILDFSVVMRMQPLKYLLQIHGLLIHTLDYCTVEFTCR